MPFLALVTIDCGQQRKGKPKGSPIIYIFLSRCWCFISVVGEATRRRPAQHQQRRRMISMVPNLFFWEETLSAVAPG
jgi:hypothetical protein